MHKVSASGVSELQNFPTGIVPTGWRFTFSGPDGASVPPVLVPYATADPILAASEPVPVAGDWTVDFSAVDASGMAVGPVKSATVNVPADVMLRVAKGLTLQVVVGTVGGA
jgi:hypothetical protein